MRILEVASFFIFLILGGAVFSLTKSIEPPKIFLPNPAVTLRGFGDFVNQSNPRPFGSTPSIDPRQADISQEAVRSLEKKILVEPPSSNGVLMDTNQIVRESPNLTEITILSSDVNNFVSSLPKDQFPVENSLIVFDSGNITVSGRLSDKLVGEIKIILKPTVTAVGDVSLKTLEASINGISVPSFLLPNFENILGGLISDRLGKYAEYKIREVEVADGILLIIGEFVTSR